MNKSLVVTFLVLLATSCSSKCFNSEDINKKKIGDLGERDASLREDLARENLIFIGDPSKFYSHEDYTKNIPKMLRLVWIVNEYGVGCLEKPCSPSYYYLDVLPGCSWGKRIDAYQQYYSTPKKENQGDSSPWIYRNPDID